MCVNAIKLTKHFDTHNNDNGKQCGEQKNREEKKRLQEKMGRIDGCEIKW